MATRTADLVEFPGEPTLRAGSAVPPVRILLPSQQSRGARGIVVLAAWTGVAAAFVLLPAGMLVLGLWSLRSPKEVAICAIFLPVAAMGIVLAGAAATLLIDLARASPLVVVTSDGLYDRRVLDEMIPWSDVVHAQPWPGYTAMALRLRRDVNARHNPFRFGPACRKWRRRPNELYISVRFLTVSPHDLAHCIATLVQRHGGKVDP
jgi:hypothetical protein